MDNNQKLTCSQIRYVLCIFRLSQGGYGVKNVELARALRLSKPSVHNMLKSLAELGIVKQESFGLAYFTRKGRELAIKYTVCYAELEERATELLGSGMVSENAICALLADIPFDKLDEIYRKAVKK